VKISIIGAAGRVGSCTAFALQTAQIGRELVLLDVLKEPCEGEALDLRHGVSIAGQQTIRAGDYDAVAGSDIVVITAGLRRKPGESRLELMGRNVELFRSILSDLARVSLPGHCVLVAVTNPVDIMTYIAAKQGKFAVARVIGTGTMFDTFRFRSLIAEKLGCEARYVSALIVGEHGDSMVPVWSSASAGGVPLCSLPQFDEKGRQEVFEATRGAGNTINTLKGGAGWAIALTARELVAALVQDRKALLPVSILQDGACGVKDVALSLPAIVGCDGVEKVIEKGLNQQELEGVQNSARVLREYLDKVGPA
jgi:L-lactate dehydrogenase